MSSIEDRPSRNPVHFLAAQEWRARRLEKVLKEHFPLSPDTIETIVRSAHETNPLAGRTDLGRVSK